MTHPDTSTKKNDFIPLTGRLPHLMALGRHPSEMNDNISQPKFKSSHSKPLCRRASSWLKTRHSKLPCPWIQASSWLCHSAAHSTGHSTP